MAKTAFATGNALTKKHYEERLFRDWPKSSWFFTNGMMGGDKGNLVYMDRKMKGQKGDRVTIGLRARLSGDGVTEGVTLEGNEESLTTYSFNLTLEELAHAVRDEGPLTRKRAVFSIDEESEKAIKEWGGEKIDEKVFDALDVQTNARYFYLSAATTVSTSTTYATAKSGVHATTITPQLISHVKTWCKTGGNRGQTPIRPIKIGGKEYYILIVHPDVMYDLKLNTTITQAQRDALPRSSDHPLFKNTAPLYWDGVLIVENENVTIGTDAGAGGATAFAQCHFMGAQSVAWAWGAAPEIVAEEFDYGREHGYGWKMIYAVGKPNFNSKDYGTVSLLCARTQIADA